MTPIRVADALVLALLAALLGGSTPAQAGPSTALLGLEQPGLGAELSSGLHSLGGTVQACFRRARVCVVEFPGPPPLGALSALPGLRYAELDRPIPAPWMALPGDAAGTADCPDLWELDEVRAREAWAVADGSRGPVVAIADSGFLTSHEELQGRVRGQFDYGNLDTVPEVEGRAGVPEHGTFVAAIVAGIGDNGVGRAGLAPGAGLNLLKIADDDGLLYFSYAVSALADVADGDLGIRVVNYSLGSDSAPAAFADAVTALAEVDVLLVAAAGNCGSPDCVEADNDAFPMYPASYEDPHVVAVAGSMPGGAVNPYSHTGARSVDLAAPGVDLCSATVDSDQAYATASGTSYATPLVAATAALLLEAHPDLHAEELARVLRASARPEDAWAGLSRSGGVLDAAAALATPVPRLQAPESLVLEGQGALVLDLENAGAWGDAALVLGHDGAVEVLGAPTGWDLEPFAQGDALELPGLGRVTAAGPGTLLRGALGSHAVEALEIELAGRDLGPTELTARLLLASAEGAGLAAPDEAGVADPSGGLAWPILVDVSALAPGGSDGGSAGDGGSDGGRDGDGGRPEAGADGEQAGGGCAALPGSRGGGLLLAALLLAGRWRGRCPYLPEAGIRAQKRSASPARPASCSSSAVDQGALSVGRRLPR